MARNSTVKADPNAPAVTELLARFVTGHPSRGWNDAVDAEAHRTFANWVGCAIGPSQHETLHAALAAVQTLQPAPQASLLGPQREGRYRQRRIAQRHRLAHLRFRRHAPEDHHPSGRAGGAGGAGAGRAHETRRARDARRAWCSASRSRAASATRSTPTTTTAAGTSPAPPACSAARRPVRDCSDWTPRARRWRWASPPRSRSACANSSAP